MENNKMENQEQVQPRRSQRQRKSVDRLQLEGRRQKLKPIDYEKHRRQREQKAAEKRKHNFEADTDLQPKLKKKKLQKTKKDDQAFVVPQYNYDADGKPICVFCDESFDDLPFPNICGQVRCEEESKKLLEENFGLCLILKLLMR